MAPPPLSPPLCTLPPGSDPPRFVCYCEAEGSGDGDGDGLSLYVTDAAELWSARLPAGGLKARCGLRTAEDLASLFRTACQRQEVAVSLQGSSASLTLAAGPAAVTLELCKVPGPEAAPRLQALTLSLAERVCRLGRLLAASEESAASPRKSSRLAGPQLFLPEPDHQRTSSGPGVRRRCPGESLINPGFKSKKPAGGVDFDES